MSSLFGIEASRAVLFVIAFAIILALVALFGLVLRKLTGARLMMPGSDRSRSRQPRLGIVDVYDLDRQRQLLLLRRDNVEHLLLIGGPNDVVIETNIVRVAGARLPAAANEAGPERFEPSLDQAQRPVPVEANGRPSIEAQLAAQLGAFVRRPSEESDVDQELSAVASVSAPVPAHTEPVLKPDLVSATAAPAVQGLRAEARTAPFPSAPVAPAAPPPAERPEPRPTVTPPPFQSRPTPMAPTPPAPPPQAEPVRPFQAAPAEKPVAPAVKAVPDAAVLSNMAKQLEEALKRPAASVTPAPAPAHEPLEEDVADADDLLETGYTEEAPVADRDEDDKDLVEEPAPAPQPEPLRPTAEPPRPAPSPLPPQQPESAPAPQKASDPFSVEDIEAEFARLLGRPLDTGKKG
ncbi:flagellar biosynthetic protein FliO [Microvirga sp. KLBC 81]|uniref:flagellar biosynthetic protein FliO n=1 Tax=Microvirga sp. KLBC 81 TaxID=1862707 RepID=UPI001FE02007|nr:flagellar biosynthetic protein FliO [Microvirga sp. KLBC 81]